MSVSIGFSDGIATVTIDRAPANALDDRTLDLLRESLAEMDRARLRGLLLTGAGDRFFSVGGDIKELAEVAHGGDTCRVDRFNDVLGELAMITAPIAIAANGTAVGGGIELLLAGDWSVGVRGARFGLPEINHGLLPSAASVSRAVQRLGFLPARRMLLSGELLSAEEALAIGLVEELAESAESARVAAREWLKRMAAKPAVLVTAIKRALEEAPGLDHRGHVALTRRQFTSYFGDAATIAARQAILQRWSESGG